MIGIYMSGTGNTEHCIRMLMQIISPDGEVVPVEDKEAAEKTAGHDTVILAYPTQFSNVPYMMKDFINKNAGLWKDKSILCMTTMGAFSGDGAGCGARLLKKHGAKIIGGLHIRMPDAVCDNKLLKKSLEENKRIVREADEKIEAVGRKIIDEGSYPQDGLSFMAHLAGLFGQRLWFYGKTKDYSDKLKISESCVGCGICADSCPMENLKLVNGKAVAGDRCAMCYRCISQCPRQAITLLGKEVIEQCRYDRYC